MKPCSASGIQSVCKTTVSGQAPFRLGAPVPPADVPPVVAAVVAAVVSAVAAVVTVAAAVVAAAAALVGAAVELLSLLSLPHATATSDRPMPTVSSDLLRRFFMFVSLPCWLFTLRIGRGSRVALSGLVPVADHEPAEPAEQQEGEDAEQAGDDDATVERRIDALDPIVVHHDSDAWFAAGPEELLADHCADHGQAGGNPKAGEDVWQRRWQLQFHQACPS